MNKTDIDLNVLFTCAANLLNASKKNESEFEQSIKLINNSSEKLLSSIENLETKFDRSIAKSSDDITSKVTRSVLVNLDEANKTAKKAASFYERSRSNMLLKICAVNILSFILLGVVLWLLMINRYPSMQDLMEYRKEKSAMEAEVNDLKKYGYIGNCNGYICIQVDINNKMTSEEGNTYYRIIPKR